MLLFHEDVVAECRANCSRVEMILQSRPAADGSVQCNLEFNLASLRQAILVMRGQVPTVVATHAHLGGVNVNGDAVTVR